MICNDICNLSPFLVHAFQVSLRLHAFFSSTSLESQTQKIGLGCQHTLPLLRKDVFIFWQPSHERHSGTPSQCSSWNADITWNHIWPHATIRKLELAIGMNMNCSLSLSLSLSLCVYIYIYYIHTRYIYILYICTLVYAFLIGRFFSSLCSSETVSRDFAIHPAWFYHRWRWWRLWRWWLWWRWRCRWWMVSDELRCHGCTVPTALREEAKHKSRIRRKLYKQKKTNNKLHIKRT